MSKAQRDELLTAVRVVLDPLERARQPKAGKVTKAEVDALKATAPGCTRACNRRCKRSSARGRRPCPIERRWICHFPGHGRSPVVGPCSSAQSRPHSDRGRRPRASNSRAPKRTINTSRDWALRPEES